MDQELKIKFLVTVFIERTFTVFSASRLLGTGVKNLK